MILECPTCRTRYLVQIGLFAQGGRRVRCARCKQEWHAKLPTAIDVVQQAPEFPPIPSAPPHRSQRPFSSPNKPTPNLPAVIKKKSLSDYAGAIAGITVILLIIGSAFFSERRILVRSMPQLRAVYETLGVRVPPDWDGLFFDEVKSELKYDSGTMKLFVDGTIRNQAPRQKEIPQIKARALGPDKDVIQSWWVEPPAMTIEPGAKIPFHTEIASPMERTIENVSLEFVSRNQRNAGK